MINLKIVIAVLQSTVLKSNGDARLFGTASSVSSCADHSLAREFTFVAGQVMFLLSRFRRLRTNRLFAVVWKKKFLISVLAKVCFVYWKPGARWASQDFLHFFLNALSVSTASPRESCSDACRSRADAKRDWNLTFFRNTARKSVTMLPLAPTTIPVTRPRVPWNASQ